MHLDPLREESCHVLLSHRGNHHAAATHLPVYRGGDLGEQLMLKRAVVGIFIDKLVSLYVIIKAVLPS